jgi:hypothetical protein
VGTRGTIRPEPEVIHIADLIEDRLQDMLIDAPGPDELCALLLVAARVVVRQTQHAGEEHLTEGAKLATALFLDYVDDAARGPGRH